MEEKKEQIFFAMVRKLVKEQGKTTIKDVVEGAGLPIGTYYTGRDDGNLPRADIVVKIARTLKTSVEELVTGKKPVLSENSVKKQKDMDQILDELEEAIKQYREKSKLEKTIKKRHK